MSKGLFAFCLREKARYGEVRIVGAHPEVTRGDSRFPVAPAPPEEGSSADFSPGSARKAVRIQAYRACSPSRTIAAIVDVSTASWRWKRVDQLNSARANYSGCRSAGEPR